MIDLYESQQRRSGTSSRRHFLKIGGMAAGGLSLPQLLKAEAAQNVGSSHKAIINIFLPGGPPHIDMFDMKPDAPREIRGEFQPIRSNVPGMEFCELFPKLAKCADKFAIIRSLADSEGRHDPFQCMTGRKKTASRTTQWLAELRCLGFASSGFTARHSGQCRHDVSFEGRQLGRILRRRFHRPGAHADEPGGKRSARQGPESCPARHHPRSPRRSHPAARCPAELSARRRRRRRGKWRRYLSPAGARHSHRLEADRCPRPFQGGPESCRELRGQRSGLHLRRSAENGAQLSRRPPPGRGRSAGGQPEFQPLGLARHGRLCSTSSAPVKIFRCSTPAFRPCSTTCTSGASTRTSPWLSGENSGARRESTSCRAATTGRAPASH